jgi:hypothetical protein
MTAFDELNRFVHAWLRRLRWQRALAWAQRGFAAGLAFGLAVVLIGLWQARLLRGEFLALAGACALVLPVLAGITAFLWPVDVQQAARTFDRAFHLQERVSTALELHRMPETGLTGQQLQDALEAARDVRPGSGLPLRISPTPGLISLCLIALLALAWFRGGAWFEAAQQARNVERAVQEETETIEELLTGIETDDSLTPAQKEALSAPLEAALNELEENPSLEGSVSVLTSTSEKLRSLSDPQAGQTAQALQQAGEQLAGQQGSPLQSVGQDLANGKPSSAAVKLANMDVSQMSEAEAQQAADQLDQMADALEASDPRLAEELRQAAETLRNGDRAAAQQALDDAAGQLARSGQQLSYSQAAELAAGQVKDGAGRVLAAGGGQQPSAQGQAGNQQGGSTGGAGAGRGSGSGDTAPGPEAGSQPIPQGNGPGDGGESAYEQIYAPSLLGGENGPSVGLGNSGEEGEVIGTGPTTPSEPGDSTVPYDEVYGQYDAANQQAIDSGDIPNDYLEIIHDYFDSIEPE